MKSVSKVLPKGTMATVAAGAMAVAVASPANAQYRDRDRHDDDGLSAGEVIVGAAILGGLAAVIASSGDDDDRYDNRRYRYNDRDYRSRDRYRDRRYDNRYDHRSRRGNAQVAVEQCARAAERQARRWGGTDAQVYEIRDVDRERRGFEVKGRIAVREGYGYRSSRNRGWDEGRFTCDFERGRVVDIDFSGIRGL